MHEWRNSLTNVVKIAPLKSAGAKDPVYTYAYAPKHPKWETNYFQTKTGPSHWLDGYWLDLRSGCQLTHEMSWNSPNVVTLLLTNIFSVTFKNKNECFKARKREMEFGYVKFSWIPTNRVGNSNSLSSVLLRFQLSRLAVLLIWQTSELHSNGPSTAIPQYRFTVCAN